MILTVLPLQTQDDAHETSGSTYDEEAWKRVVQYGERIKTLNMHMWELSPSSLALADSVKDIVTKKPPSARNLLPKLKELKIIKKNNKDEDVFDIVQFSLAETTRLSQFSFQSEYRNSRFIDNLRLENLENLRELELFFFRGGHHDDFDGIRFLDRLLKIIVKSKQLQRLALPHIPIDANADIRSYLANQTLEVKYLGSLLADFPDRSSGSYVFTSPMSFLNKLDIYISFSNATSLRNTFFPQLKSLTIYSMSTENEQSLEILSNHIRQEFPNLESITLASIYLPIGGHVEISSSVAYANLQPIFTMDQLQNFTVYWPHVLTGTDDDFKSLFDSRLPTSKKFKELDLSPHRGFYLYEGAIQPTHHVLPFLAEHANCSSLTKLKLQLDCSGFSEDTTADSVDLIRPFLNLKHIDFGYSLVPEDESTRTQLAKWVARIIPTSCFIECTYEHNETLDDSERATLHFVQMLRQLLVENKTEEEMEANTQEK